MSVYFLWGGIGIFVLFLGLGALFGMIRGWKRGLLHFGFTTLTVILSFLITKPIANAILGINMGGKPLKQMILDAVSNAVDLSAYPSASGLVENLPLAIVSPLLFILLTIVLYYLIDIIYAIVARVSFGKKKNDFKEHKPYRSIGSVLGVVEAFMFMVVLFAPISSLTMTAEALLSDPEPKVEVLSTEEEQKLQTVPELVGDKIPSIVLDIIKGYNSTVVNKITSCAGLDDAIFDSLSTVKANNENITIRPELVGLVDTYNNFVPIYNNISSKNWDKIDISALKPFVEKVLDSGLFKGGVAPIIKDFVVKFNVETPQEPGDSNESSKNDFLSDIGENLPEVAKNIIEALQDRFKGENFKIGDYLKHDILLVVDIADDLFDKGIVKTIVDGDSEVSATAEQEQDSQQSFEKILSVFQSKSTEIKDVAEKALSLNILSDAFKPIVDFGSKQIEKMFENTEGLVIGLNSNVDKEQMIDDLFDAVDNLLTLNEDFPIADFMSMSSEDLLGMLVDKMKDDDTVDDILTKAGETIDTIRNLEILKVEKDEKTHYILDNILKASGFEILGDEVKVTEQGVTTTETLDTYTKFFNYLKTPIKNAIKMGILEIVNKDVDFDTILDNILAALGTENSTLFADTLMPFYDLHALNLSDLVFGTIKDQLQGENALGSMISFENVNNYDDWNRELGYLGETLIALNRGEVEVTGAEPKSYIKYILDEGIGSQENMQKLLKALTAKNTAGSDVNDLQAILRPVFKSTIFNPFIDMIFDYVDNAVQQFTNVDPATIVAQLKTDKDDTIINGTISTIDQLFEIVVNIDMKAIKLQKVGELLDVLKVNAKDGGVFKNIFVNLIWYITGHDLSKDKTYPETGHLEKAEEIVKLLGLENANDADFYNVDFTAKMKTADQLVDLAKNLNDTLQDGATPEDLVDGIKETFDQMTAEEAKGFVDEAKKILESTEQSDLLNSEFIQQHEDDIKTKVDEMLKEKFGEEDQNIEDLKQSIFDLLGIGNVTP